jgi:hypothetical protein
MDDRAADDARSSGKHRTVDLTSTVPLRTGGHCTFAGPSQGAAKKQWANSVAVIAEVQG